MDLMRPLADHGVTASIFQQLLLEIKAKVHTRHHIAYMEEFLWQRQQPQRAPPVHQAFSTFSDRSGYNERVPHADSLQEAQLAWFESVRPYYDLELKKRGGEELHVDVSYKVRTAHVVMEPCPCHIVPPCTPTSSFL